MLTITGGIILAMAALGSLKLSLGFLVLYLDSNRSLLGITEERRKASTNKPLEAFIAWLEGQGRSTTRVSEVIAYSSSSVPTGSRHKSADRGFSQ